MAERAYKTLQRIGAEGQVTAPAKASVEVSFCGSSPLLAPPAAFGQLPPAAAPRCCHCCSRSMLCSGEYMSRRFHVFGLRNHHHHRCLRFPSCAEEAIADADVLSNGHTAHIGKASHAILGCRPFTLVVVLVAGGAHHVAGGGQGGRARRGGGLAAPGGDAVCVCPGHPPHQRPRLRAPHLEGQGASPASPTSSFLMYLTHMSRCSCVWHFSLPALATSLPLVPCMLASSPMLRLVLPLNTCFVAELLMLLPIGGSIAR